MGIFAYKFSATCCDPIGSVYSGTLYGFILAAPIGFHCDTSLQKRETWNISILLFRLFGQSQQIFVLFWNFQGQLSFFTCLFSLLPLLQLCLLFLSTKGYCSIHRRYNIFNWSTLCTFKPFVNYFGPPISFQVYQNPLNDWMKSCGEWFLQIPTDSCLLATVRRRKHSLIEYGNS